MNKIPEGIRTLANACSMHFRASARLWTLAATITLVVLTAKKSEEAVSFLGFAMDPIYLYPVCAALLAIVNIAYCSTHLQAYRIALIYHDLLNSLDAENLEFSPNFSVADVAHALYASTLNRIYPFTHFLPRRMRRFFYTIIKIPTDLLFYGLPLFGCLFALGRTSQALLLWPLIILVLVSAVATLILLGQGLRWVFFGPAGTSRQKSA